jgi:hypothetical protein
VPEVQILQPHNRRRLLFAGDPLPRPQEQVLQQSIADLAHAAELRELGLALFLDRPLGVDKQPGETDQTLLLSHRAFSRSLAQRRSCFLAEKLGLAMDLPPIVAALTELPLPGVPLAEIGGQTRPGAVSVADARQVAEDFVFLQTTPATVAELLEQYDFRAFPEIQAERALLIVPRRGGATLTIHDAEMNPRLELTVDASEGYCRRAGRELLRGGLRTPRGVLLSRL